MRSWRSSQSYRIIASIAGDGLPEAFAGEETDYCCPSCGFEWSGNPRPVPHEQRHRERVTDGAPRTWPSSPTSHGGTRRVQDAHADLLATASMTVVPGSVQDE